MTKYVVFLRGINVGGRTIKMAELRAAFEAWGFRMVTTVLQTGNVRFESNVNDPAKLKQQIETELSRAFNYPAKVQMFTIEQLRTIVDSCPFAEASPTQHRYVVFLESDLAWQLFQEVKGLDAAVESIQLGDGVIYWQVEKGMTLKSTFAKFLTKPAYKTGNTNRNINTLQQLLSGAD
jgi:uncharacterized protein (DUF1697 family)